MNEKDIWYTDVPAEFNAQTQLTLDKQYKEKYEELANATQENVAGIINELANLNTAIEFNLMLEKWEVQKDLDFEGCYEGDFNTK